MNAVFFSHKEKSQVTHNSGYYGIFRQLAIVLHVVSYYGHDLVAVYNISQLIHR